MITQIVMISTIVMLCLAGYEFLKRSKKTKYFPAKIFGLGLFLIALAILFYSIRDILVQFNLYGLQTNFLIVGGLIHIIGAYSILWFVSKEFGPRSYFKYIFYVLFGFVMIAFGLFLSGKVFKLASDIQQAPLEPFQYLVVRNYVSDPTGILILYGLIVLISILILGVILFNSLREKERVMKMKGLFYGFGAWFLISPMIICTLISPIFARIGYLIGAILIYKALKIKI